MRTAIGTVTHYYNRIGVAVLSLEDELNVGDVLLILGRTSDLLQALNSMEINHHKVYSAGPEAEVAIKVEGRVRRGDRVYKLVGEEADLALESHTLPYPPG